MNKNKIIVFLDSSPSSIEDYSDEVERHGYKVLVEKSAEKLLSKIKDGLLHPDVIITELILEGMGETNNFYGKRDNFLNNCPKLLADELDILNFKCKLVVLTSWTPDLILGEVNADQRFSKVLDKFTGCEEFATIIDELLQ